MPKLHGKVTITAQPDDGYTDEYEVPLRAELFSFAADHSAKELFNPHNLPVDPVSIALTRAMGIHWRTLIAMCAIGSDGISVDFTRDEEGPHEIFLPDAHPMSRHDYDSIIESWIRCGNQAMSIQIDDHIHWQAHRTWPDGQTGYIDLATLSIPTDRVPLSTFIVLESKAEEGELTLLDVLSWEDAEIPAAKILEVSTVDDYYSFLFRYPSGEGGFSQLPI